MPRGILKHCSYNNAVKLAMWASVSSIAGNRARSPAREFCRRDCLQQHDVEDGIRAGLITIEQLLEVLYSGAFMMRFGASMPRSPAGAWYTKSYAA